MTREESFSGRWTNGVKERVMNPRSLLYATVIALAGVGAGIAAFLLARLFIPGWTGPLAMGLAAVLTVDLIAVWWLAKILGQRPPPPSSPLSPDRESPP